MNKIILEKFHKKIWQETLFKSLIYGFIIGSIFALTLSIIFNILKFDGLWIIISSWLVTSSVSALLFKVFYFKTTLEKIAKRMDTQFELDERVITMVEYQDVFSVTAEKQRNNAKDKISLYTPKNLKFQNILKPLIILIIISSVMFSVVIVTSLKIAALSVNPPIIEPDPLTPEEVIIEKMIEELRSIVNNAEISQVLKNDLHKIIDRLVVNLKFDVTIDQKMARIENTRREILEIIEEAMREKTTIIDEMKTHDSTHGLGIAFESGNELLIQNTIEDIVIDFIAMSTEQKISYLEELADDIEQSVDDADIKDKALEEVLEDIIRRLRELIPKIDGERPDELGDELQEILEQLGEILSKNKEENTSEDLDQAIQDALDELENMKDPSDDPTEPDEDDEDEDDQSGDEDEDGEGEGQPIKNPVIIDGETEFSYELYQQIRLEFIDMIANNEITEDELIELINQYMSNIEQRNPGE